MTWAILIPLIAQYGLPLVQQLVQKWESGAAPTAADFTVLLAASQQTAKSQMTAQLTAAGIPLTDPHAVALLALVGG
jgi:hypothetical protein